MKIVSDNDPGKLCENMMNISGNIFRSTKTMKGFQQENLKCALGNMHKLSKELKMGYIYTYQCQLMGI